MKPNHKKVFCKMVVLTISYIDYDKLLKSLTKSLKTSCERVNIHFILVYFSLFLVYYYYFYYYYYYYYY